MRTPRLTTTLLWRAAPRRCYPRFSAQVLRLRRRALFAYSLDPQSHHPRGCRHFYLIADAAVDERAAHGRYARNPTVGGIRFGGANNSEAIDRLAAQMPDVLRHADLYPIAFCGLLDNHRAFWLLLDFVIARLDVFLVVLSGVQLGVFAKVFVQHCLTDLFADARAL